MYEKGYQFGTMTFWKELKFYMGLKFEMYAYIQRGSLENAYLSEAILPNGTKVGTKLYSI